MARYVDKVTAFITRGKPGEKELLLLAHPFAGNQIPAGTVEMGETAIAAVLREVAEETGLTRVSSPTLLAQLAEDLPPDQRVVAAVTHAYARPDVTSFDWVTLRRGITVNVRRQTAGFTQVEYIEHDQEPEPTFVTYHIVGWVPDAALATARRRSYFQLTCDQPTPDRWTAVSDNHTFTLFWARLNELPPLIAPQDAWLAVLIAGGVLHENLREVSEPPEG
ncbi:MAG: NUDIX domain-containing protein [Anaerolineales bacterium]|nr:NUDIX domain-containing protein [Anaerolineales bacterium]